MLTKSEARIVAAILLAFLTGLTVMHFRAKHREARAQALPSHAGAR